MSASTDGEDTYTEGKRPSKSAGLVAGHAYTLISAVQLSTGQQLVRLRNPWGNLEWNGDWGDNSSLWTPSIKAEIIQILGAENVDFTVADDGIFWMSWTDVLKHFCGINVCLVRREGLNQKPWSEVGRRFHYNMIFHDEDTSGNSNHGIGLFHVETSLFTMTIPPNGSDAATECIVTIHQRDERIQPKVPYIDVGVAVFRIEEDRATNLPAYIEVSNSGNRADRQQATSLLQLTPGKYLIKPTTAGGKLYRYFQELDARRTATATAASVIGNSTVIPPLIVERQTTATTKEIIGFSKEVLGCYEDFFHRLDDNDNGLLSKEEMDAYTMKTEGSVMPETTFAWLINEFESEANRRRHPRGLTLGAFLKAQFFSFRQCNFNTTKLLSELASLGYEIIDGRFQLHHAKEAAVSIHSTNPNLSVEILPYDPSFAQQVLESMLVHKGTVKGYDHDQLMVYKYISPSFEITFLIENKGNHPLKFTLDCSGSVNMISNLANQHQLVQEERILPGQRKMFMTLLMGDETLDSSFSASYKWVWNA
jgi:hypothetical protein